MKNLLRLLMGICLCLVTCVPANAFYPDVDTNHWAFSQIKMLSQSSVVVGYPDGTFQPDENVTRAEFASMAIRALGQEHTTVVQPVNFEDIDTEYWAYDSIQKALYFDLISNPKDSENFRPEEPVSRAEALAVAVNALTTEQISVQKAQEVLAKTYKDVAEIPEWFVVPAGKAEILGMVVVIPSDEDAKMEAERPATRAEVTAILFNMIEQAKLNPNAKLAEAMRKKTGEGFVVENAIVQGSVGTIPAGSVLPIQLGTVMGSQISEAGDMYIAKAPQNYITKDKYILVYKGADLKGQLKDVVDGKLFFRNGVVTLSNEILVTPNDQAVSVVGIGGLSKEKGKFMTWVRKVFKGEKLLAMPNDIVYIKLTKPIKVDLTNGWIFE